MSEKKIILASNSPRRKELLRQLIDDFEIILPADEKLNYSLTPPQMAMEAALIKARSVYDKHKGTVIGADTIVELKGEVFLKPKDEEDAKNILKKLSGKRHCVITGVCVITDGSEDVKYCKSFVKFNRLTDQVIEAYVKSGLPLDKAGAYGIQDGFGIIKTYSGSYTNIVGLPLKLLNKMLRSNKCK